MCGGQGQDPYNVSKPQPGQFKPMDAGQQTANSPFTFYNPPVQSQPGQGAMRGGQPAFQDMGSAGGNMAWGGDGMNQPFQYRPMAPSMWPPQGGRAPPPGGRGFPPPPAAYEGRAGGNMSWGGDGWTPPQQPITNPMDQGGALGNYPAQPQQPAFGGFQAQPGSTWDPPGQKDFAPGGGFYPTTTPTNIPSVTAGWMGLGGQAPNPNMTYNPVTRQWS